ncbi:MAG: hypothetical protein PHR28_13205 [candidate division Zixibacteria bacterium]|nr:hypothetical protein [candidate division Zixibacteria bacterium]
MKTLYHIDPSINLIAAKRSGAVRVTETMDLIRTILSDGKFRKGMGLMYDLTEAEGDWSMSDIDRFRSYVNNVSGRFGASKWAFILKDGTMESSMRILILLHNTGSGDIAIRLFRNKFEALRWMNSPDDGAGSSSRRKYDKP